MKCHLCGSDSHLQRDHSDAVKKDARSRLAAGENPIHIISDLLSDFGNIGTVHDECDDEEPLEEESRVRNDTIDVEETLNLFDHLTSSALEENVDLGEISTKAVNFLDQVDQDALKYHIRGGMRPVDREPGPTFQ